jgi:putative FmdB family regulatory protein
MPNYDYKCICGYTEIIMHNIKVDLNPVCPKCGETMVKQISGGGLLKFKGPGFYQTDYKDKEDSDG